MGRTADWQEVGRFRTGSFPEAMLAYRTFNRPKRLRQSPTNAGHHFSFFERPIPIEPAEALLNAESYVANKREKAAALAFLKKALKRHGQVEAIVTDGLKSYPAAMRDLHNLDHREMGRLLNNRAETSHLPFRRRERAMLQFRQIESLRKFASVHANIHIHFNLQRHRVDRQTYKTCRSTAVAEWQKLMA